MTFSQPWRIITLILRYPFHWQRSIHGPVFIESESIVLDDTWLIQDRSTIRIGAFVIIRHGLGNYSFRDRYL